MHRSERGWNDGYQRGYPFGYHLGRCQAIQDVFARRECLSWNGKVLYVRSGLWAYAPIDDGIVAGFQAAGAEIRVMLPDEDVCGAALQFHPEWIIVLNSVDCFSNEAADRLRAHGFRTVIWFTDDPYYMGGTLSQSLHYDVVLSVDQAAVPVYQEAGCEKVHYLPLAANTDIYRPQAADETYQHDLCFIGSGFSNRLHFFDQLADYLADKDILISGYWWDQMSRYDSLSRHIQHKRWLPPQEAARYYSRCKIIINLHRAAVEETGNNSSQVPALSLNPRTFEINACGAFQLCDAVRNVRDYFTDGTELAAFSSAEEFIAKVEHYLKADEERRLVALNGFKRTWMEHSYQVRVEQLIHIVEAE